MDEKSRLARNRYSHPRNDFLKRTSCNYKAESSQYDITGYPGSLTRIQKLLDGTNPPVRVDYVDRGADTFVWGPNMLRVPTPQGDNPWFCDVYSLFADCFGL